MNENFSGILGGLAILVLAVYTGVKLLVGAINVPIGSITVEKESLQSRVQLPPGFHWTLFADDVPNARELRITRHGDLLVATPNRNQIIFLARDQDGDGRHDKKIILDKLNGPNGIDFYTDEKQQDWLYVAEEDAIGRILFSHDQGEVQGEYQKIVIGLPSGGNHWKKSLRFGPDDMMYVSIGSSCNVCIEKDERRAAILRYRPDGSSEEIFASGLRNSEGFDWSPEDGALYATDNGRDLLGDDFPPCELNKIEQGLFYGWPFENGDGVPDPDYGKDQTTNDNIFTRPVHNFRAHNAPLGIAFLHNKNIPDSHQFSALVALHGSWNRSKKDGYKVVSLHWQNNGSIIEKDFMSGFLNEDETIGRPAEIAVSEQGDIYISDDYAGAIYYIRYTGAL